MALWNPAGGGCSAAGARLGDVTALRNDVDAYECRDLFVPSFVSERLADLVWSRSHDEENRKLVVREILRRDAV